MRGVGVAVVPLLALLLLADGVHSALHDHYLHTPCNFLAFVAFNGPDFLQCIPQGTLMAQVQLYDVAFAYMRAHTHIYHGTTDGSWVSDQIYDDSFYSLTPNYAKLHGMTHSYFPTKISPSAYAKVGTAYTQPKIAVYDITNANSGTPDYLLLEPLRIEKLVKQIGEAGTDAWHKVWADEYDEQKDKDTGSGVNKKKVPPNVAAMRTMATKWNTQVPHIPLKGLIQHRFLPQVDLTVIMGGWMGRKSNRDALPTAQGNIDVATVKAYLHAQANFKNLEDFCGIADESRDIDTFLYDEMIVFGKPFAHVRDDVLDDPSTGGKEDAIMTHIQAWAAQCGQLAFTDPPYSIDYRTWIPRGSDLDKPLNADVFSNGLTLAQLRTEVDGVVNTLDGHIPAGPGHDAFPKFKTLLTASSTGLLTGAQLSELRVHAYLILRAFCDDEDAWKAVQPDHHNNANNAMKNRICKRAYLSLNDPVVPLSHHHFFHSAGLNDNAADKQGLHKCKWSWSQRKCLPEGQCARQYHFGDFKMDKSCRVKP